MHPGTFATSIVIAALQQRTVQVGSAALGIQQTPTNTPITFTIGNLTQAHASEVQATSPQRSRRRLRRETSATQIKRFQHQLHVTKLAQLIVTISIGFQALGLALRATTWILRHSGATASVETAVQLMAVQVGSAALDQHAGPLRLYTAVSPSQQKPNGNTASEIFA